MNQATRPVRSLRSLAHALVLLLLAGSLSGCTLLAVGAGGAAGVGGAAYILGDLEATLQHPPQDIAAASEKAFDHLGIKHIETKSSKIHSRVVGRTTSDKKVTVETKLKDGGLSETSIRVGLFGDEEVSRSILKQIERFL